MFLLCPCILEAWNLFLLLPGANGEEIVLSLKRNFGIWTFMQYWSCENCGEFEVRLDAHCLMR